MVGYLENFTILFSLIILGQFFRKLNFYKNVGKILHFLILYICLPSLVISTFWKLEFAISSLAITLTGFCVIFSCIIVSFLISKNLKIDNLKKGSFIITSSHANTGFLGYPLIFYFLGSAGLYYAVFYDLAMFISLLTIISLVASYFGSKKLDLSHLKSFLKFPPLFAFILGIILNNFVVQNYSVINLLNGIGSLSIYLVIFYLGVEINLCDIRKFNKVMPFSLLTKLLISPLIAFLIVSILSFNKLQILAIVLQAGMPSGMLTLVLSKHYKLDTKFTSTNIFSSTIFGFLTLGLIFSFLQFLL